MDKIAWLWTTFISLTWWQMTLWVAYTLYFIVRSYAYWDKTEDGLWKGYRSVMFGCDKHIRVYHIVRFIFDIPPATFGLFFPILRKVLAFKIYEFKDNKKTESR